MRENLFAPARREPGTGILETIPKSKAALEDEEQVTSTAKMTKSWVYQIQVCYQTTGSYQTLILTIEYAVVIEDDPADGRSEAGVATVSAMLIVQGYNKCRKVL